jgi:hypothetical protein
VPGRKPVPRISGAPTARGGALESKPRRHITPNPPGVNLRTPNHPHGCRSTSRAAKAATEQRVSP